MLKSLAEKNRQKNRHDKKPYAPYLSIIFIKDWKTLPEEEKMLLAFEFILHFPQCFLPIQEQIVPFENSWNQCM